MCRSRLTEIKLKPQLATLGTQGLHDVPIKEHSCFINPHTKTTCSNLDLMLYRYSAIIILQCMT